MDLPPNWTRYETDEGKEYFHNSVTNETQWDRPKADPGVGDTADVFQYQPSSFDLSSTSPGFGDVPTGGMVEMSSTQEAGGSPTVSLGNQAAAPGGRGSGGSSGGGGSIMGSLGGLVTGAAISAMSGSSGEASGGESGGGCSGYMLEKAQQLFDVSTTDVVQRLRMVVIPTKPPDGAKEDLKNRPDFYGPFWVATTAVLFFAATGNFARLIALGSHHAFKPDYGLVSLAACMIYGSLILLPAAARGALFFSGEEANAIDFRQIVCVCGYAMTPMIPVSLLCLIPLAGIRWLVTLLGIASSLYFLHSHLLAELEITAPGPKMTLTVGPPACMAIIFLVYRVHFF